MDVDEDGVLSKSEFQSKMSIMGWSLEEAEQTFQAMDHDGDGGISANEYDAFCHMQDKTLEFGTLDGITNLRQQLVDLRAKLAAFASKDASTDAEIKDLKKRLVATEKQLAEEKRKEEEREANLKQDTTQVSAEKAEAERRIEMCKRVVRRMLKHQLLMAWNMLVDTVRETQHNRETVRKVLSRMQHRQLAGAFDCNARAVNMLVAQRKNLAISVTESQADDRGSSIVCKVAMTTCACSSSKCFACSVADETGALVYT
jgi:septal ring factor EnvC (AmiA/AmiB activator)